MLCRLCVAFSVLLFTPSGVFPHELLAGAAAESLTASDRQAATRAESEALDRDEVLSDFTWSGPDGASGLIIVSGEFPSLYAMGGCRRLVHLIRHPKDGGVNPTFDGVVCRSWDGKWAVKAPQ